MISVETLVRATLEAWRDHPDEYADDDVDMPSRETIERALDVLEKTMRMGIRNRTLVGVSMGGFGTVSIEFLVSGWSTSLRVESSGLVRILNFGESGQLLTVTEWTR